MLPKKIIIIDFDGTIVDSNHVWKNVYHEYCSVEHLQLSSQIDDLFGQIPFGEWFATINKIHGRFDYGTLVNTLNEIALKLYCRIEPKDGFAGFIERNRHNKIMIISREDKHLIKSYLDHTKIDYMFAIYQDLVDYRNGCGFYEKIAAENGCSIRDMLFIDDSLSHCAAAKKAGAFVIGMDDHHSKERQEQMASVCDMCIVDFTSL